MSVCLSVPQSVRPSTRPSVRLSVLIERNGCHWTYCHEILCLSIFLKSVEKIHVLTRITGSLREDQRTFMVTARRILLGMKNITDGTCRENENIF